MRSLLILISIMLIVCLSGCPKETAENPPEKPPEKPPEVPVDPPPKPPEPPTPPEVKRGPVAPDFILPTLDGRPVRLSSLKGNVVVLCFWSTHCSACRVQMPTLVELGERVKGKPILVVSVTWGVREDVKRAVEEFGLKSVVLVDTGYTVAKLYNLTHVPTTFMISPDGRIEHSEVGPTNLVDDVNMKRLADLMKIVPKSTEKPAEKPSEKPAEKPADKPAAKPAD